MQLSVLIAQLQALQAAHGDLPVWVEDADTGWLMEFDLMYAATVGDVERQPCPHLTVSGGYGGRYTPDFGASIQGVQDVSHPR